MLCEKCGKNEATVHYSEIINGKKSSYTLCRECADKMGIGSTTDPFEGFGAHSLLSGFFGDMFEPVTVSKKIKPKQEVRCPICSASLREIAEAGKVGCSECYRTFRSELSPTIRRIHGGGTYKGSSPAPTDPENAEKTVPAAAQTSDADALRAELYEAIKNEEFERAAELRDRIRALEQ